MDLGPFDLPGTAFLQLYGVLFVITIVAGFLIPRWLRPEGGSGGGADADQLAYLAGGQARFGDTVVARLLASEALVMEGSNRFDVRLREAGRTAAERSVLTLPAPARWSQISKALAGHGSAIERKLVSFGLLMDGGTAWQMRFWQTTPYLLLIVFGAVKWEVGVSRDKPVGFLTMFLIVTLVFALIRFAAVDRRTRAGIAALNDARATSQRLKRAPTASETDLAVALFGTAVLAGSGWDDFHKMRSASSGDTGSSSSSDSGSSGCSSSGCGGGGCGGCGS